MRPKYVVGLGGGPVVDGQANNGHDIESATIATLSTSVAPVSTLTHGRRVTASPSPGAAKGRGRPATASPSISAARGRGWRATTPQVVTSPEILAPISHASPQPEVHPPIPDASPQSEVLSPTPPLQPIFYLSIVFHLTLPILLETPSYTPTSTNALTMPVDPPTSFSSDPLRPPVGIDTVQPAIDVPDEQRC